MKLKLTLLILLLLVPLGVCAEGLPTITVGIGQATDPGEVSTALQVLIVLTILSVAPAILLMTTGFTRIVIVLSFMRQAIGTQSAPSHCSLIWRKKSINSRHLISPFNRCVNLCFRRSGKKICNCWSISPNPLSPKIRLIFR